MTKEDISRIIKESRMMAGLTQTQVAEKLGRPQATIAGWEVGRSQPDANTLFELFRVLGRSVDEAFGFTKSTPPLSEEAMEVARDYEALLPQGRKSVREEISKQTNIQWASRILSQTLAQNMREFRGYRGLSQKELAEKTGIPIKEIREYESDYSRSLSVSFISEQDLNQIAKVLELSPKLLLGISMTNETMVRRMNENYTWQMNDAFAKLNPVGQKRAFSIIKRIARNSKEEESSDAFTKYNEGCISEEEVFSHLAFLDRSKAVEEVLKLINRDGGKYRTSPLLEGPQPSPAPREGTDTTPAADDPETPPEGE